MVKQISKDKVISIRLSEVMLNAVDARAVLYEKDRTQVIRDAISHYLDLPEEGVEEKIEELTKKQDSLDSLITKLRSQLQNQSKRTDQIETRLEELRTIIGVALEGSK
jgi:metal-responsive CopG/Arc/MetJ family transcriptional regulator